MNPPHNQRTKESLAHTSGSNTRRRMRLVFSMLVALVFLVGVRPVAAQSSGSGLLSSAALDSALVGLNAPDWNDRHSALERINTAYPAALPVTTVRPILDLLTREVTSSTSHEGDEGFGEYLVDLVLTAVRTGDVRAIPSILALDGLGISSGVENFVASRGREVMPLLDSLASTREDHASDVAETYALMYAHFGARLTHNDSVRVLRRFLNLAGHPSPAVRAQVTDVAGKGSIAELTALVVDLSTSDTEVIEGIGGLPVRRDALAALPALRRALTALPTPELLNRLTLLTEAACLDANAGLAAQCATLSANLATAGRYLAAGQGRTAVKSIDAYQRTVQRLVADKALPRLTSVSLDGTARSVVDRLL